MVIFDRELRENWFDKTYTHAGYVFKEVHREEEFVIFKASDTHFEVFQRRVNEVLRNYLPNKSHWGTYAWTCMSLDRAYEKIKEIKEINNE